MKGQTVKRRICLILLGVALSAPLRAAAPAANCVSAQDTVIDTRLNAAVLVSLLDEAVDTRLNFVIWSLGLSKIDTITKPGTLLLLK